MSNSENISSTTVAQTLAGEPPSSGLHPLVAYFRSGWAFLIPYLAAYLLYAWLKWPVNPVSGEGLEKSVSESVEALNSPLSTLRSQRSSVPSLLHVYWFLHGLHLILAAIALRAWWRNSSRTALNSQLSPANSPLVRDRLWPLFPWICLALIFWIPGIYLEWPSDPWEHLRRINEWHILDQVTAHSSWKKSSYFLPYSLTGHTTGLIQLTWLNLYYVCVCLALGWQYFRLARAVGLGERASFIFVLLGAVTFGNNVFSFYRYYGLSTSIVAQLVGVAIIRMAVESAMPRIDRRGLVRLAAAGGFALLLIVFNHLQGIGIVALAVATIAAWKLCANARPALIVAAVAFVVLSSVGISLVVSSPVLESLRLSGWLSRLYGFNLLSPSSPAFERGLHILGWFGALNLFAGFWLLRTRHLAGFLTVGPICLLALPHAAVPISMILNANVAGADGVLLFQRLLFAIPASLAIVVQGERVWLYLRTRTRGLPHDHSGPAIAMLLCVLFVFTGMGGSAASRFWHSLFSVPEDLSLHSHIDNISRVAFASSTKRDQFVLSSKIGQDVFETFSPSRYRSLRRVEIPPISQQLEHSLAAIGFPLDSGGRFEFDPAYHPNGLSADVALIVNKSPLVSPVAAASLARAGDWTHLVDSPPVFESVPGNFVVSNPRGLASAPFSRLLIPVERSARYRVSVEARAVGPSSSQNYLAVGWYDANQTPMLSRNLRTADSQYPKGWINGDYSYFGLTGTAVPGEWTTYTMDFGQGERSEIPREAAFFRVGALLNQDLKPAATTQIQGFTLMRKPPYGSYVLAAPQAIRLVTPGSVAGLLSGHWTPYHAATDHVGSLELDSATAKYFCDRQPR